MVVQLGPNNHSCPLQLQMFRQHTISLLVVVVGIIRAIAPHCRLLCFTGSSRAPKMAAELGSPAAPVSGCDSGIAMSCPVWKRKADQPLTSVIAQAGALQLKANLRKVTKPD